jgi:hypothetical protein
MCLRKVCFRQISADFAQISRMVAPTRGLSRVMSACGSGLGGSDGSDGPCCSALTQACQGNSSTRIIHFHHCTTKCLSRLKDRAFNVSISNTYLYSVWHSQPSYNLSSHAPNPTINSALPSKSPVYAPSHAMQCSPPSPVCASPFPRVQTDRQANYKIVQQKPQPITRHSPPPPSAISNSQPRLHPPTRRPPPPPRRAHPTISHPRPHPRRAPGRSQSQSQSHLLSTPRPIPIPTPRPKPPPPKPPRQRLPPAARRTNPHLTRRRREIRHPARVIVAAGGGRGRGRRRAGGRHWAEVVTTSAAGRWAWEGEDGEGGGAGEVSSWGVGFGVGLTLARDLQLWPGGWFGRSREEREGRPRPRGVFWWWWWWC